jgi:hypothetical protein
MILQLVLMWGIVLATIVWFVRDERRLAHARLDARARYFATAPQYRHLSVEPLEAPQPPALRTGGLSRGQRSYFETLASKR